MGNVWALVGNDVQNNDNNKEHHQEEEEEKGEEPQQQEPVFVLKSAFSLRERCGVLAARAEEDVGGGGVGGYDRGKGEEVGGFGLFSKDIWTLIIAAFVEGRQEGVPPEADREVLRSQGRNTVLGILLLRACSKRLAALVDCSRVWCALIDLQFGDGRSNSIAETEVLVKGLMRGKKVCSKKEIEEAKARFYRKARLQFIRMWVGETFRFGFDECPLSLVCTGHPEERHILVGSWYIGVAILWNAVVVIVITPLTHQEQVVREKLPHSVYQVLCDLYLNKMTYRSIPVVTWEMIVTHKRQEEPSMESLILRLRISAHGSVSLCC